MASTVVRDLMTQPAQQPYNKYDSDANDKDSCTSWKVKALDMAWKLFM